MALDFNVSPYYDDYDPKKDFYRVLFQPGVAVQARELNQLQSILQNQIEKFGDNIFKRGTIIEGCNITKHDIFPYVKIKDLETDGTPVSIASYENLSVRNSSNVSAYIVKTVSGFESRAPDLNTLYVTYNGSGTDSNTGSFSPGDILQVFDSTYPIFKMKVIDGSSKFSNADTVVVMSAIAVTNSTGGNTFPAGAFQAGHIIQNGVANATIIEANTTANSEALILKIKPLATDLISANTIKWRFGAGDTIRNATTANVANVAATIGVGAEASITTDTLGKITALTVTSGGAGYYVEPHVTVKIETTSSISSAEIAQLDVSALNYLSSITVANSAVSSIGTGYGITVDEGTIYQKGFFSRVSNQIEVVNKYSNTGFTKSVGFSTVATTVNSNQDTSLLDNATGTYNYAAPGADRLKLTPVLYVLDKVEADANTDFLPIIEFADGNPYKQNLSTIYNVIGDEIAKRTYEESGNYFLNQFTVTTKDSETLAETPSVFKIAIDPGTAYINGYRVQTNDNYIANVEKGIDTANNNAASIRLGYGNFIRVKELGGVFEFNTGATVELYDTAKTYLSLGGGAITTVGTKIGEARIRSVVNEASNAEPGSKDATYRLYLFDIVMSAGKNFSSVRSIYHGGTNKGIADVVLNSAGAAELIDTRDSSLLFKAVDAMKAANNMTYTYRTVNQGELANSTGYIVLNLAAGENFPYAGQLNTSELRDFVIVPLADYEGQTNATGTITTTTTSTNVAGAGGMDFRTSFNVGDWVKFGNTTSTSYGQVAQITGASSMILTSNAAAAYTGGTMKVAYPKNIPISLTNNGSKWANVETGNSQVLTIYIANTIANTSGSSTSANIAIAYNATRTNVSSVAKTVQRNIFTRIRTANNDASVRGPWALGVSDVFRLRNVYIANGASRDITFNVSTDIQNSGTANAFLLFPDTPFANGDSLVYSNTAGVGVLGGLANNGTYYVVHANSSGFALSATRGGANLTLTANSSSTHKFTGSPLFFGPNTFGVTDVTNDFYIDMNHKEDYMDTSYLYRKPRRTVLSTNDVLLVKYDAFTGTAGVKTVSSYPISDGESFTALSASANVHTMELPEFIGTSGKYYDLRDQFDFRPRSNNTIGFITDITSVAAGANAATIINPSEPSDATRFASTEQYFPAPDTTLTANIEYYLGRSDRVVVNSEGDFIIRRGKPGFISEIPSQPKNSLTLDVLRIAPYPSIPLGCSSDIIKIIDTKVGNETLSGTRRKTYTVVPTFTQQDRNNIQVKSYKMADIGALENRIATLEYYVGFTLAEALANARFIPSSLDALLNRFRYGFFVDPFTDYNYADVGNPEFWATIRNNQLGPKLTELNLEFKDDGGATGVLTLPFTEFNVITQADATDGPVVTAPPVDPGTTTTDPEPDPTGEVTTTTVTQTTATVTESQRSISNNDNGSVYEDFFYTMSSLFGPVEFYINSRDNNIALEVFQSASSSGPWASTYTSATALPVSSADISNKGLSGLNDGRPFEHQGSLTRKSYGPAGGFLEDHFKLLWNHDPAAGRYYRLRIYKGSKHGGFLQNSKAGTFGFKLFYPTDSVTTNTITTTNPTRFTFNGTVNTILPSEFTLQMTLNFAGEYGFNLYGGGVGGSGGVFIADSQAFKIAVTGLKPNTYHKFIFNNEDQTAKCSQSRTTTTNTDGLLSDANGVIAFDFYYDAGINEATTDIQQQNKLALAVAGVKSFVLQSFDGTSKAGGSINMKYYTPIWMATETATTPPLNVSPSVTTTTTTSDGLTTLSITSGTTTTNLSPQALDKIADAIDENNVDFRDRFDGYRMSYR
jgi:hypothetical protein